MKIDLYFIAVAVSLKKIYKAHVWKRQEKIYQFRLKKKSYKLIYQHKIDQVALVKLLSNIKIWKP